MRETNLASRLHSKSGITGSAMFESRGRVATFAALIPLGLAVVTLVASTLVGWLKPQFFFWGIGLTALLAISIGLAQFAVGWAFRSRDRDALYGVVSTLALASGRTSNAGVLSEAEVLGIEAAATEVWVYAYDLAWEDPDEPFNRLVRQNLARGVTYRYLIPDDPDVIRRATQMRTRLLARPKPKGKLEIASTSRERVITQFGLTIYNPAWSLKPATPPGPIEDTVAVYFPHYKDLQLSGASEIPFLSLRGTGTRRVQEAFVAYWDTSTPLVG